MFEEWVDPNDIDHHYEGVGSIFQKVADYIDPTKQISTPIQPVPPVLPQTSATQSVQPVVPPTVSKFEIVPDSIYVDGHPVGHQPKYNILRSGPPEGYRNRNSCFDSIDMTTLILIFLLFVMLSYIIHLHINARNRNQLLCMLVRELMHKK